LNLNYSAYAHQYRFLSIPNFDSNKVKILDIIHICSKSYC